MNKSRIIVAGLAAAALAGCGAGAAGPPTQTQVNVAAQSTLQFAVGTANVNGVTGMNVLVTFRQGNGQSAALVNTPTLTGPFSLAGTTPQAAVAATSTTGSSVTLGPSTAETGAAAAPSNCPSIPCITGAPQQPAGTLAPFFPYVSSFGVSGGAFGIGFEPANYTSAGAATSYTPYGVPLFGASLLTPWGGPPAYDPNGTSKGTRDGTFSALLLGVGLGLDIFNGVAAGAGTYNLSVNIPAANAPQQTINASFGAGAPVVLATIAAPTLTFDASLNPSATYVMPAGFVGEYIEIWNVTKNAFYTFWRTDAGGTVTVTPAMAPGAPGTTAAIASSGDTVRAIVIGFDYNHYAPTYNGPLSATYPQAPALPGRADVSVSGRTTVALP